MKKKVIGLIDGESGNIGSIKKAIKDIIKNRPYQLKVIKDDFNPMIFDKIILPGQGAYATLISNLKKFRIYQPLKKYLESDSSYLGICVGMQLMFDFSLEKIKTSGFSWLSGNFKKIKTVGLDYLGRNFKVPHMGWNSLQFKYANHPILKNLDEKDQYYFVHSYYLEDNEKNQLIASTNYCHEIPAIVGKDNYIGVQFHPEKSSLSGQKLISNWLKWQP